MKNSLITYIKQRFNPILYIGFTLYIFFFSIPFTHVNKVSFVCLAYLFLFLFVFRLYDDLMNTNKDTGLPNRDYTNDKIRNTLVKYLIGFAILLLSFSAIISIWLGLFVLIFVVLNHFFYLIFKGNNIRAILPLLKYPIICAFIQFFIVPKLSVNHELVHSSVSLFFIMVTFESLEDSKFIIPIRFSYLLQFFSLSLIFLLKYLNTESQILFSLLLLCSLILTFFRIKLFPYLFLLFVLILKLFISNYVV